MDRSEWIVKARRTLFQLPRNADGTPLRGMLRLGDPLGDGAYGAVHTGMFRERYGLGDRPIAVKEMVFKYEDPEEHTARNQRKIKTLMAQMLGEELVYMYLEALSIHRMSPPTMILLAGFIDYDPPYSLVIHNVFEKADSDLYHFLRDYHPSEALLIQLLLQVLLSLIPLVECLDLVHNDLYTKNILIFPSHKTSSAYRLSKDTVVQIRHLGFEARLTDFGLATSGKIIHRPHNIRPVIFPILQTLPTPLGFRFAKPRCRLR